MVRDDVSFFSLARTTCVTGRGLADQLVPALFQKLKYYEGEVRLYSSRGRSRRVASFGGWVRFVVREKVFTDVESRERVSSFTRALRFVFSRHRSRDIMLQGKGSGARRFLLAVVREESRPSGGKARVRFVSFSQSFPSLGTFRSLCREESSLTAPPPHRSEGQFVGFQVNARLRTIVTRAGKPMEQEN